MAPVDPKTLTPQQLAFATRMMRMWDMQLMKACKQALRHPNVLQETVLDTGGPKEFWVTVIAEERAKLILPEEWDDED